MLSVLAGLWLLFPGGRGALAAPGDQEPCDPLAKKATEQITVNFQTSDKEVPGHACIVSYQAIQGSLKVDDLTKLDQSVSGPGRIAYEIGDPVWDKKAEELNKKEGGSGRWPTGQMGKKQEIHEMSGRSSSCQDLVGSRFCRPEFALYRRQEKQAGTSFPLAHYIQCAGNTQPSDLISRVAVLLVEVHTLQSGVQKQPLLCRPRLDRNVLTFAIEKVGPQDRIVSSIVGGHYAEMPARVFTEKETQKVMELSLVRRCQLHDIALPPTTAPGTASVWLEVDGERAATPPPPDPSLSGPARAPDPLCRDDAGTPAPVSPASPAPEEDPKPLCTVNVGPSGHFRMELPYLRERVRRTVKISVGNRERSTYARYEASWNDFAPPPSLALRQTAVSFRWKRDCLYPMVADDATCKPRCPEASLIEAGLDCDGAASGDAPDAECVYLCDRAAASGKGKEGAEVPFDLPAQVRFRRPRTDDMWTERLVYANQTLEGFVPAPDRHVDVDLSAWGDVKSVRARRAATITRILLRGPNGDVHHVDPKDPNPRVALPGARCGQAVAYTLQGDRLHREGTAILRGGKLEIPHPEDTEERWFASLTAGLSVLWPTVTTGPRRFAVPAEPTAAIGGVLSWRPGGAQLVLEARYTYLLGSQSYFRVLGPREVDSDTGSVVYSRHLFEAGIWYAASADWRIGGSIGVLAGLPLSLPDASRVGDVEVAFTTTAFSVLYQPLPHWGLEAGLKLILGEPVYAFESTFDGAPAWSKVSELRGAFELRLRYTL